MFVATNNVIDPLNNILKTLTTQTFVSDNGDRLIAKYNDRLGISSAEFFYLKKDSNIAIHLAETLYKESYDEFSQNSKKIERIFFFSLQLLKEEDYLILKLEDKFIRFDHDTKSQKFNETEIKYATLHNLRLPIKYTENGFQEPPNIEISCLQYKIGPRAISGSYMELLKTELVSWVYQNGMWVRGDILKDSFFSDLNSLNILSFDRSHVSSQQEELIDKLGFPITSQHNIKNHFF